PERSTLECVLPLYQYGNSSTLYEWVIEGDIEGCFDNIDHGILMKAIQKRIADRRVLWLIRRFLKAPVIDNGKRLQAKKGTPQGGILSPLLANIYLNEFDQYWNENWGRLTRWHREQQRKQGQASCVLFRYADDFALSVKGTKEQAAVIMDSMRSFFAEKLRLNLSTEKTRVVSLEDGFDFLGFRIQRVQLQYGKCVRIRPTQRNLVRLKTKLQAMLGIRARSDDLQKKVTAVNRVLRGWANYYRAVNAYQQFETGDYLADRMFQRWYCNKYQIGVRRFLSEVGAGRKKVIRRGPVRTELFRMTSIKNAHTALNHGLVWKYRHIGNPYINPDRLMTSVSETVDNPIEDIADVQPIHPAYDDEIYLSNRLLAFERDGWKCVRCGSQEYLQAHHIEAVPRDTVFDPKIVHRVENLQTLCMKCHNRLPER
ncbi:MAG: HNH endonuclease, partial [Nitrososphaerota archaeon]|nr:HNH endonuclease [Nitrososphaerota archaeon]